MELVVGQRVQIETRLHIWTGTVVKLLGETVFGLEVDVQLDVLDGPWQFMVSEVEPILGPLHQTEVYRKARPSPEVEALAQQILRGLST